MIIDKTPESWLKYTSYHLCTFFSRPWIASSLFCCWLCQKLLTLNPPSNFFSFTPVSLRITSIVSMQFRTPQVNNFTGQFDKA